jgi:hypothetical protein
MSIPSRSEGRIMIATNVGRVAVDAGSAENERHESVRQRRVVLTPRCWRRRWQQYMAHRGEHVISRKAIAQGMSDVLRCPVCSCAHFLCTLAHETSGAARIRHSLRPLISRARKLPANLGRNASRECESVSTVIARSPCDEAIHSFSMPHYGLLRFARNDGVG